MSLSLSLCLSLSVVIFIYSCSLLAQSQICTQFDEAMKTALVILKLVRSHLPSLLIESYRLLVN